jgi:hypothetical protein
VFLGQILSEEDISTDSLSQRKLTVVVKGNVHVQDGVWGSRGITPWEVINQLLMPYALSVKLRDFTV